MLLTVAQVAMVMVLSNLLFLHFTESAALIGDEFLLLRSAYQSTTFFAFERNDWFGRSVISID